MVVTGDPKVSILVAVIATNLRSWFSFMRINHYHQAAGGEGEEGEGAAL